MKRKLADEITEDVVDAIRQLPTQLSEPLLLFLTGSCYDEIGQRYKFTTANAWRRVRHARCKIYRRLLRLDPEKYERLLK